LLEKLIAESSGILNWMLDGLRAWQKNGLQTPKKIAAATAAYRDEQDIIGEWIDERYKTGAGRSEAKGKLYEDYKEWAKQNGHGIFAQTRLTRRLTERLTERHYPLTNDKRKALGIALAAQFIPT
jgi:putative DNA primase/helicase